MNEIEIIKAKKKLTSKAKFSNLKKGVYVNIDDIIFYQPNFMIDKW